MKKIVLFCSAAGIVFLAGCQPRLAQVSYSSEEASWQQVIRRNYAGYRAPRTQPPAVSGNTSDKLATVSENPAENPAAAPAPAEDPANQEEMTPAEAVDKAQENAPVPAADPAEKTPAPAVTAAPAGTEIKPAAAEPPDPTQSTIHVVRAGDTLAALAKRYYGDSRRQDVIVRANADLVRDPNKLYPGMKLIIPKF